jgi:hypothetical protein
MSTPVQVPPYVDISWRDDLQAAGDAAAVLRISMSSPEAARLTLCAQAAGLHICRYLDRKEPIPGVTPGVPPEDLRFAHAHVTVELYRRKDAPFGVLDAWSPDSGATRIGSDPLSGVKTMITPYKNRWGLG